MSDAESIAEAAKNAEKANAPDNARRWLIETLAGTLCTTTARRGLQGYPFGSVVPFALTADGRPFILIANIATHTANLKAEPRASLFVRQPNLEGDPQKGWRITVMGTWAPADTADFDELHARYVERVPFADGYLKTHGFAYWEMKQVEAVRYIGGFGEITWLDGDSILREPGGEGIEEGRARAIEHMNEDHAHNMVEMCKGLYSVEPESVEMVGLDRTGFLVRTSGPERLLHFSFGREIGGSDVRHAVVDVLKRARAT